MQKLLRLEQRQISYGLEAQKLELENRKVLAEASFAEILLQQKQREEAKTLADNEYHHVFRFNRGVDDDSVNYCMKQLDIWKRQDPGCDIELVINSPGGSVIAGMTLYDYLQEMKRNGHKVTTVAMGMAASMGGILLQAGNVRAMGKEAYVLIHQISTIAYGKITDIEDEVAFVNMIQERVLDIFAERAAEAGANGTASSPLSKAQFKKRWERKDWWVSSSQCLEWGIVDRVC